MELWKHTTEIIRIYTSTIYSEVPLGVGVQMTSVQGYKETEKSFLGRNDVHGKTLK